MGEGERIEQLYLQALDLWRELGDLHGQARTLNYLGLIRARVTPCQALGPYEEALAMFRRIGDVLQEGVVLSNIGGVYDLAGEPHLAHEHFRRSLEIHQRLGNLRQEATVRNNVASIHRRTGRFQDALAGYNASLEIRRRLDDRRGQGRVLNNLGLTWLSLGELPRVRDMLDQALVLRRESDDQRGAAITMHNLSLVSAAAAKWNEALDWAARARDLHHNLRDRGNEAMNLVAMGEAASRLGRPRIARRHLEDALAILDEMGNPWRQARAWGSYGKILIASGAPAEAAIVLRRALQIFRDTADEISEGDTLLALARAERFAEGRTIETRLNAAYAHATAALDALEAVRADIDSLTRRASFLSRQGDAFELAGLLAMELHRLEPAAGWAVRALEISERARARSLLDLLKESGAGLRLEVDAPLLERRRELLDRLKAKVDRRRRHLERRGPSAEAARWAGEIREVRTRLDEVENEIRRQSPGWSSVVHPLPLEAGAVRALLDPETTLLEFSLGEERSFLWAVTAERIEGFELPGRETIEAVAREVYEGLRVQDPRALRADTAVAARLVEILLGPVAARLGGQRLVIVAGGALHYVPFAALPDPRTPSEPLLVRHEIVALPSASALGV